MTKLKIRISLEAYDFIMELLKFHNEYNCIYLSKSSSSCCKSSKVDITLDVTENKEHIDTIDDLKVAYDEDLYLDFSEIIIALSSGNLYLKTVPAKGLLFSTKSSCSKKKK